MKYAVLDDPEIAERGFEKVRGTAGAKTYIGLTVP